MQKALIPHCHPSRPCQTDDAVLDAAAELLTKRVFHLWGKDAPNTEDERQRVTRDLREVLLSGNGYERARELDRMGYFPNAELVELLDDADMDVLRAHDAAVEKWVREHGVTVPVAVGQKVRITVDGKPVDGEVIRVDAKQAMVTVYCPSLGHVRSGESATGGTLGVCVPAERFEALP